MRSNGQDRSGIREEPRTTAGGPNLPFSERGAAQRSPGRSTNPCAERRPGVAEHGVAEQPESDDRFDDEAEHARRLESCLPMSVNGGDDAKLTFARRGQ